MAGSVYLAIGNRHQKHFELRIEIFQMSRSLTRSLNKGCFSSGAQFRNNNILFIAPAQRIHNVLLNSLVRDLLIHSLERFLNYLSF